MFCKQCGTQIEEGMAFCTNCGAKVENQPQPPMGQEETVVIDSYVQNELPKNDIPVNNWEEESNKQTTEEWNNGANQEAIAPVNNWNNTGSNTNQQTATAASVGFGEAIKLFFVRYADFKGRSSRSEYWWAYLFNLLVSSVLGSIPVLGGIVGLGLLIPGLALCVRRLHDTGKRWTFMLWSLLPLAGAIILLIQVCKESDGDNEWGPAPRN